MAWDGRNLKAHPVPVPAIHLYGTTMSLGYLVGFLLSPKAKPPSSLWAGDKNTSLVL